MVEVKTKTKLWDDKYFIIDKKDWGKFEYYWTRFGIDTMLYMCYKPEGKQAYLYAQWYSKLRDTGTKEIVINQDEGYVKDTKIVKTKKELVQAGATDFLPVRKVNQDASLSHINFSQKGLQESTGILFKNIREGFSPSLSLHYHFNLMNFG